MFKHSIFFTKYISGKLNIYIKMWIFNEMLFHLINNLF